MLNFGGHFLQKAQSYLKSERTKSHLILALIIYSNQN